MDYLENIFTLTELILIITKINYWWLVICRGEGPTTNLNADELDFDLNTKDLKISMYSEERVKIKTKF